VIHYWSLAIEEQFYLVWPLLLGGLYAVTRRLSRPTAVIRAVIVAGALASLIAALFVFSPLDAYRRTDARAYQLLAGAFLALTPGIVTRLSRDTRVPNVLAAVALAALMFVASSALDVGGIERGFWATIVAIALIVSIEAAPSGPVARLLSLGPVVYLGLISYGTYLWQWPVVVVARIVARPNHWQVAALSALVATALASLSFQMLERPIRESPLLNRWPRVTIAAGLAVSVGCAIWIVPKLAVGRA
jgi:peptidoglycan/LPS O-acetylase OafA/YrhL